MGKFLNGPRPRALEPRPQVLNPQCSINDLNRIRVGKRGGEIFESPAEKIRLVRQVKAAWAIPRVDLVCTTCTCRSLGGGGWVGRGGGGPRARGLGAGPIYELAHLQRLAHLQELAHSNLAGVGWGGVGWG